MAIEFINDLTDKQGGAINKTAGMMAELRKKASVLETTLNRADQILANMDLALPPNLPTLQDLDAKLADIETATRVASADAANLTGIAGSCLDGALGALNSMKKDAFSLVNGGMQALDGLAGLPADMIDLTEVFNQVKDNINSLGITELIAGIYDSLGCLSNSSLISDVNNELVSIQDQLGLDIDGSQNPTKYKQMMAAKLDAVAGLDPTYKTFLTDGMSSVAEKAASIGAEAKQTMKDSVSAAKNSIPKVPALPKYF